MPEQASTGPSFPLNAQGEPDFIELFRPVPKRSDQPRAAPPPRDPPDGTARELADARSVEAASKELVMKVYLDADENYTVTGYGERARQSFGEIYLCLDKGAEYDRQSGHVNAAIQSVTEAEAFHRALLETRAVLSANPQIQDPVAIVGKVLARLCRHWFDIPDGAHVQEGGPRHMINPPPVCAGDYVWPSAFIFNPVPDDRVPVLGPACGALLKAAVERLVHDFRASGTVPQGLLSRAVFEAFPEGEDELIVRTLIGIMMGMLPTVLGNLSSVVLRWKATGEFDVVKAALLREPGRDPHERADRVLKVPFMRTMQLKPAPLAVWRTAVKDHVLQASPPIEVHTGDVVHVLIERATQEDHQAGSSDVFPVFGGDRSATPHPTHACPGYKMAIGMMLGIVHGMMEPQ